MRIQLSTAVLGAVLSGSVILSTPALAVTMTVPAQAAALSAANAAADREFVIWISATDFPEPIRTAARLALTSTDGDAAIADFLATGYDAAVERAARLRAQNVSFAERMLARHPVQFYPNVNAAAQRVLWGTYAELAAFAATGFAAAKEADRRGQQADADAAAAVVQTDRNFVTRLAADDPGAQVRAAAVRALASGTAADVAEFFLHRWVSAAALDVQTHRARCADADAAWRAQVNRLEADARAAQKAAEETAGEAGVQLRAAAARAWAAVGAQTSGPRVAWAQAQQVAETQAATWQQVAAAAGSATGSNWNTIADTALGTRSQWQAERENAATQAAYWQALYARALAAEQVLNTPAG